MRAPRNLDHPVPRRGRPHAEGRAGAQRLLRSAEWLSWPRVWVLPPALSGAASVSSDTIPWIPEVARLAPGLYALGPALPEIRALPAASAANDHRPWRDFRARPLSAVHRLRTVRLDPAILRATGRSAESTRRFPRAFPKLTGDADAWRTRALREIAAVRDLLGRVETVERRGWSALDGERTLPAVVPLAVGDDGTVRLAEPPRGEIGLSVLATCTAALADRESAVAALARLAAAPIPALPEAFFLAHVFSGGTPDATTALLDDLGSYFDHLRSDWEGPIPDGPDPRTVQRLIRRRQAQRVAWVGAGHGLVPGTATAPAFWLAEIQPALWTAAGEDGPCDPGRWNGRCERAEHAALRLAIGLGAREIRVLGSVLLAFVLDPGRLTGSRLHESIDHAVALARAGVDPVKFLWHRSWDDLAAASRRRPDRVRRILRHPWFGPRIGELLDCEDLIDLPEPLLGWLLDLPSQLAPEASQQAARAAARVVRGIVWFLASGENGDRRRCARFLADHRREIARALARRTAEAASAAPDDESWSDRTEDALAAWRDWEECGLEGGAGLFAATLDRPDAWHRASMPFLAVALSGGSVPRFFELLERLPWFEEADARCAWDALRNAPRVRQALIAQPPSRAGETVARLRDIACLVRFAPETVPRLAAGPRGESPGDPPADPLDPAFAEIRAALPDREEDLRRLQWLQRRRGAAVGPSRALRQSLRRLASPPRPERVARRLDAALRAEELARVRFLADEALRRKLAGWLRGAGSEDAPAEAEWLHAVRLGGSMNGNRRCLRRLLRAERWGQGAEWIRGHPANRRFLDRLTRAGADAAAWVDGLRARLIVDGLPIEIRTEDRPLEVLRMGTLFGTCLAAGDVNSHAAVANALDLNKRVLYVSEGGRVVARKLVAVVFEPGENGAERPVLVGYRLYGQLPSRSGPEDRSGLAAVVHECCDEWAARCRLPLGFRPGAEPDRLVARSWYDDGQVAWDEPERRPRPSRTDSAVEMSPRPR